MARPREYIRRGTFTDCITAMFDAFAHRQHERLAIINNTRGNYYALVSEEYLAKPNLEPYYSGHHLVLHMTLPEAVLFASYKSAQEGDLFANHEH